MYLLKIFFIVVENFVLVSTDNLTIDHDYYKMEIYPQGNPFKYKQYLEDMSDSKVQYRLSNQSIGAEIVNLTVCNHNYLSGS